MIRFLVFSDLHYDHVFDADERIKVLMKALDDTPCDFVISLGDLCCPIKENLQIAQTLRNLPVPFYLCVGNHDCEYFGQEEIENFWKIHGLHDSFVIGDTKFLVLNSCFMNHDSKEVQYQKGIYDKTKDTYPIVSQQEMEWLKSQMSDSSMKYVVFSHHSLANAFGTRGIANRNAVREILETKNTLLCMNGHDHGDDIKTINGIPYFTVNSISYIWHGIKPMYVYLPEIQKKYPYLKDIILYDHPLYCIVEIEGNEVKIRGMDGGYQKISPEEVGIVNRQWNGVSIEPVISSWDNSDLQ